MMAASGLSESKLQAVKAEFDQEDAILPSGEFATLRLTLCDDTNKYSINIQKGRIESITIGRKADIGSNDLIITASSEVWKGYFKEIPGPLHADLGELVTEKRAHMTGNVALYWQNIEYLDNLFRHLGHRIPLGPIEDQISNPAYTNGQIEETVGRYIHVTVEGHTYRIFYEESGKGIPLLLLHAANSDARMWRHQLADTDLTSRFRVIAFDMPWHGRSLPPQELMRTEYLLTNTFYRRIIRAFCDALNLVNPVVAGCSMGGYILFHAARHDAGRYRALIAIAARDFEPRRWALEQVLRNPAVSFNRLIPTSVRGFMAPQDPPGHVDEVAWVYETGNPRTLRGDLHFAALDCDSRPFLSELDVHSTPFYLLGGEYDWSCTAEHTSAIKAAQPGIHEIRMAGIGHFPPDENPEVFNKYFLPALLDAVEKTS